jgi:ABC-type multidrug transport system ATPase subunit
MTPVLTLRHGMVIGRAADADFTLDDPSISRRHFEVEALSPGWKVTDLGSRGGTYLNGRLIQSTRLTWGDILQLGNVFLRFDGIRLEPVKAGGGASLSAIDIRKTAGETVILDGVSVTIQPGEFVGVIGPSGAGKSSLLDALCGLRPADSGEVLIDGQDLYAHPEILPDQFGYVPQDDIVPQELTVRAGLDFSALLRLPYGVPVAERMHLVEVTLARLGLKNRADTRVGKLSGGQRKRVSVAAELLMRPRLLFLDEPTSGLDPAAEFTLMEQLRGLAANGCTVVCTTHVLENAHLMDRIIILAAGRLVYDGAPAEACAHFGVGRLTDVYLALQDRPRPTATGTASDLEQTRGYSEAPMKPASQRMRRAAAFPILLAREWAILCADWKNLLLLIGQPVLIAFLVTWVSSDTALVLFFSIIATLWFGCGNAAQEVVRELPMFRRERLVGLSRGAYLSAKFVSLSRLTMIQSLLMYGCMQAGAGGLHGDVGWQLAALMATSLAAVSIGLAISGWARSVLQAVMLVPLILIPQILFSGFTPPAGDMKSAPYFASTLMPSASARQVMDVSLLWNQTISGRLRVDVPSAFSNLNRDRSLKNGEVFSDARPGWWGLAGLAVWVVLGLALAGFGIRLRERNG